MLYLEQGIRRMSPVSCTGNQETCAISCAISSTGNRVSLLRFKTWEHNIYKKMKYMMF
jgi:hypothetical protein